MSNPDSTISSSAATKNKKTRKKKPGGKVKPNGIAEKVNGGGNDEEDVPDEEELEEPETPTERAPHQVAGTEIRNGTHPPSSNRKNPLLIETPLDVLRTHDPEAVTLKSPTKTRAVEGDRKDDLQEESKGHNGDEGTRFRLDALERERIALRDEVAQLRRALEEIQEKHKEELEDVQIQLAETGSERDQSQAQYQALLGKVNTIRSQLGERLKADAEDLSQARNHIEDLEEQNGNLREQNESRSAELAKLADEGEQKSRELSSLRNRMNLSQQNWVKEREHLGQREAYAKEEFDTAKQAMQDWEVLAMEERSIRENLTERVSDLEEQLASQREALERAVSERDSQSLTVDGLQRALQGIQEERKRELREVVENSQAQVDELRKELKEAQSKATESTTALESAKSALENALPFESEVKEKNLLIGKLRHEAVILNDHLTKALRYLKKGKPEDNIDKQLVTNHLLHFLPLERSDPRKFQVLQIMASLLNWTDEQREQAGLARPGASNPNLRAPISPWHRTPSTPALSTEFFPEGRGRGESIGGLWQEFLEQEAQGTDTRSSRATSISSTMRTAP